MGYIAQVPDTGGIGFEPRPMIAAVNRLRPLGSPAECSQIAAGLFSLPGERRDFCPKQLAMSTGGPMRARRPRQPSV